MVVTWPSKQACQLQAAFVWNQNKVWLLGRAKISKSERAKVVPIYFWRRESPTYPDQRGNVTWWRSRRWPSRWPLVCPSRSWRGRSGQQYLSISHRGSNTKGATSSSRAVQTSCLLSSPAMQMPLLIACQLKTLRLFICQPPLNRQPVTKTSRFNTCLQKKT